MVNQKRRTRVGTGLVAYCPGVSAYQFGTSQFAARGLLPGPFDTGRIKRRPHGRVYARVLEEDPLLRAGAPLIT
jgi:hypothetical protein